MADENLVQSSGSSSLWIEDLVDGVAGIVLKARHADYCGASPFQKIEVFDTYAYGRVLMLAGTIVLTEKDEHVYSEMIAHPALLAHPRPRGVCIIGGGDGGCLRETLKHDVVEEVTVAEIDAQVRQTVETYFAGLAGGFADRRVTVAIADGRAFLDAARVKYDVIIVDSYDPGGPVASLETADFHRLVAARLLDDGIAVFQTDAPLLRPDVLRRTLDNTAPLFGERSVYLCTLPWFPGSVCSFCACAKEKGVLERFDEKRYAAIAASCRYYNDQIHRGSRMLPQQIRAIVESSSSQRNHRA
jgi:spermidine synthase